ncbi:MAG: hypothetical protein ACPG5P_05005, partial [Saprospiraceae bacterium]
MENNVKRKSFWGRPEGTAGMIFGIGILAGLGFLGFTFMEQLIELSQNVFYLGGMIMVLAAIVYMVLDPRMRNLVWYGYKSVMRWITGMFVQIDPIGILKSYIEDLKDNLRKMNKQVGILRGQMHKLKEIIKNNDRQIQSNLNLANRAKQQDKKNIMILKSRKAGRLKDSNLKLTDLYKKM